MARWQLCARGVEKKLLAQRGVHHVEANFLSGSATVHYDESQVSLADLKKLVGDCGYACAGECLPQHVCKASDPASEVAMERARHAMPMEHAEHAGHATMEMPAKPAGHAMPMPAAPAKKMEHSKHAGHAMPMPAKPTEHAEHAGQMGGEMAATAHEMEHGVGMSMEAMVRDLRNRFLVALIFAVPIFLYSPLFTDFFKIVLPVPFGLNTKLFSFILATPPILYSGWVFYVGAWRALRNGVLNMAVLVTLSVLAGYLFSVAATFLFESEVFYEAAALLLKYTRLE